MASAMTCLRPQLFVHAGHLALPLFKMTIPGSFSSNATLLLNTIAQSSQQRQVGLVFVPHDRWPIPRQSSSPRPLRISVLDSSFNPPTLAHLALARAPAPAKDDDAGEYDARLLLLSVRNADKTLKPGDATYLQRLEMMFLLAQDIQRPLLLSPESLGTTAATMESDSMSNVAIAIIDEPTFIGKSTALLSLFRSRLTALDALHSSPRLTFLLGLDTLERLFATRYYPSEDSMLRSLHYFLGENEGEGSSVVCARRDPGSYPSSSSLEDEAIPPQAQEFISTGRITMINIGAEERTFSSSQVRNERSKGAGKAPAERWDRFVTPGVSQYIRDKELYLDLQ